MFSLKDKAMLASLSISQWTARKYDKKASKDVIEKYHASSDAGRFNKMLIAKSEIEAIPKIANEARATHYANTLAWGDDNERLLPSANYFTYKSLMDEFFCKFDQAADSFESHYPTFIENARSLLNGLWNPNDYPSPPEIRAKFSFEIKFNPIPDSNDFRVNITDTEIQRIQQDIEKRLKSSSAIAMKDLYDRTASALSHMVDRLEDSDAIFRDTLVSNLSDLVVLLPKLNVINDPKLDKIRQEIESRLLSHINPQVLREDGRLRKHTAQTAQEILDQMSGYTGGSLHMRNNHEYQNV